MCLWESEEEDDREDDEICGFWEPRFAILQKIGFRREIWLKKSGVDPKIQESRSAGLPYVPYLRGAVWVATQWIMTEISSYQFQI